jgi:hypothetical protein
MTQTLLAASCLASLLLAAAPQTPPDAPDAAAPVTSKAAAPRNPALRDLLARLVQADQAVRARALADPRTRPGQPITDPAVLALIRQWIETSRYNTATMKRILDEHGWPGKTLVGKDGAHDAWLLVQHADGDRAFQKRCLDLIRRAAARGEASKIDMAYLTDRILVAENKPQVYGTQFRQTPTGGMVVHVIEDEANVDARRQSVGLPPLADYKRALEKVYGSKPEKGGE